VIFSLGFHTPKKITDRTDQLTGFVLCVAVILLIIKQLCFMDIFRLCKKQHFHVKSVVKYSMIIAEIGLDFTILC
ncbi:MAG: hypothetical protein Q4D41_02690, partial [Prevotellaceae bacterium]|nr:hypothetical protein [Prevotellaceae bacterium]